MWETNGDYKCIFCRLRVYTVFTLYCARYPVSVGVVLDRVFCCQTDAAQQDEEEDEVGEDVVVDNLMAENPKSKKNTERNTVW